MKIRWNENLDVEIIDHFENGNIGEDHDEILKKGTIFNIKVVDMENLNEDGDPTEIQLEDAGDYVDIQFFGNQFIADGSIIACLLKSTFTVLDERTSTPEDCEKCDEKNCDVRHCIISAEREPESVDIDTINTATDYAALTQKQQVSFLIKKHDLSEKEACEYRTNDIYGLPVSIAKDFDDYDDSKYPDENR